MKFIRPIFYFFLLVVLGVSIELKKAEVRERREAPVVSVLSLMGDEGLPIKVFNVRKKEFAKQSLYHLKSCPSRGLYCLGVSGVEAASINIGNKVREPDTENEIGRVRSVSGSPDSVTGLYTLKIEFDQGFFEDGKLVKIDTLTKKQAIVVPLEALSQVKDKAFVYLFENEQPKKVSVEIGEVSKDEVLINSGIKEGDVLIVEGLSLLELFDKYQVVGEFEKLQKRDNL